MDRQALQAQLELIVGDYLRTRGLELVELIYRYEGNELILRVFTDKPEGGIDMGECSFLNREISRILDEKDIPQERYLLEVSSPGLERPLIKRSDFLRCLNKHARFFLNSAVNGKIEWVGRIVRIEEDSVVVNIEAGEIVIPLANIDRAKQIISC